MRAPAPDYDSGMLYKRHGSYVSRWRGWVVEGLVFTERVTMFGGEVVSVPLTNFVARDSDAVPYARRLRADKVQQGFRRGIDAAAR